MMTEFIRITVLSLAVVLSFSVARINLHGYELPIAILFFIGLFVLKKVIFPHGTIWRIIEGFIFTVITVFTVLTTGGVESPFFFLIYFLLFSLSILFEPPVSLSFSMVIILLFIFKTPSDMPFKSLIPIFSLAFLVPFALLLSQERIEIEKMKLHDQALKEDTYLFLSLTLKKHLIAIKEIAENIRDQVTGDKIKKRLRIIEKLIQRYEEQ